MKLLADSGLVDYYKEGKWMHYSISADGVKAYREMIRSYVRCDCEDDESVVNECSCKSAK
jgi:ArsR family transcriptional regulator